MRLIGRSFRLCALILGGASLLAGSRSDAADAPLRVLFVTQSQGFVHSVVKRGEDLSVAEVALTQLGEKTGLFKVDCTQNCEADFTRENLKNYDIVAFYTTGDLPIAPENMDYFLNDWLKQSGHGVLGFHSATDTYKEYEPFWDMIGGTFIKHPWTSRAKVVLHNHEVDCPVSAPFGQDFAVTDEIYMYKHWQPEKVRVLLSLDYSQSPVKSPIPLEFGYHVPVCWIKSYGDGKVYVNNLGHNASTWTNKAYLDSIVAAVKWMRGDIEVDSAPNPDVSKAYDEQSKKDFEAGEFEAQK